MSVFNFKCIPTYYILTKQVTTIVRPNICRVDWLLQSLDLVAILQKLLSVLSPYNQPNKGPSEYCTTRRWISASVAHGVSDVDPPTGRSPLSQRHLSSATTRTSAIRFSCLFYYTLLLIAVLRSYVYTRARHICADSLHFYTRLPLTMYSIFMINTIKRNARIT